MLGSGLFALVAAALAWSSLRVAARWGATGWDRVAGAAAVGATAAVLVPLACGLAGLGTSRWVLAGVTLAIAAAAGTAAGRPETRLRTGPMSRGQRAAAGGAGGFLGAMLLAQIERPEVRTDGYHLTEVVRWLHEGHPGTVELVVQEWPAGAYPLANDLILTWAMGIARSFSPAPLWTVSLTALLAGSFAALLLRRGLRWEVAALGATAATLVAGTTGTLEGVATDLPSIAWLAAAASLLAHREPGRRHPPLALLALGLAVGTKTTTAFVGGALFVLLAWPARHRLRRAPAQAISATVAALAVAAPWPLRNLIEHGSPLWPFSSLGFGDPVPYVLSALQSSFLDDPEAAARMYWHYSTGDIVTGALLIAGALAAAAANRSREVLALAAVASGAALMWATSPITGAQPPLVAWGAQASIRYALPALLVALAAIALSARGRGRRQRAATGALVLIAALCVYLLPLRAFASMTAFWIAVAAAVATAVVAARAHVPRPPAAVAVVLIAAAGAFAHDRFLTPVTGYGRYTTGLFAWLAGQPAYRNGDAPVVTTWRPDGRLAGPQLAHDVILLPTRASCAEVRERARRAWLVVRRDGTLERYTRPAPGEACMRGVRPAFQDGLWAVYAGEAVRRYPGPRRARR